MSDGATSPRLLKRWGSHKQLGLGTKLPGVTKGLRVMFAVNGGRVSERAVHEVMTLLRRERKDAAVFIAAHREGEQVAAVSKPEFVLEDIETRTLKYDIDHELVPCEIGAKESLPDSICAAAKEYNVDLLVMGSNGMTKTDLEHRDSVAYAVIAKAHCMVAVVNQSVPSIPLGEKRTFGAAVDTSPLAQQAFEEMLLLSRPTDTVLALYCRTERDTPEHVAQVRELYTKLMTGRPGRSEVMVLDPPRGAASPGQTLCKAVDDNDVDFIAIGSHGLGKPDAHLGSVGRWVVQHAKCHVLVVKAFRRIKDMSSGVAVSVAGLRWLRKFRTGSPRTPASGSGHGTPGSPAAFPSTS